MSARLAELYVQNTAYNRDQKITKFAYIFFILGELCHGIYAWSLDKIHFQWKECNSMPLSAASSFILGWRVLHFCTIEALCFRSQPECAAFVSLPCLSNIQRNETLQMFIQYGLRVLYYVFYAILYQSPAKASLH